MSAGLDPSIYKKERLLHDHSNFTYSDVDILLRYEITYNRLSIAFFGGYAWRDLEYFDDDHTGSRFKYGVELNDLFIPPRRFFPYQNHGGIVRQVVSGRGIRSFRYRALAGVVQSKAVSVGLLIDD